jgi:hypothetical protein
MASTKSFFQSVKAAMVAESTLSVFEQRMQCSQAGYFNPEKVRQPNLVISPAQEAPRPAGRRLLNARDDLVTVTFYAYAEGFGKEEGLFTILDIATVLKCYLEGNQFAGTTVPRWVSTIYPTFFARNFEKLSEVRITMEYGLRGA